jgi:AbrB family looped-hinge helix DNA binding protein
MKATLTVGRRGAITLPEKLRAVLGITANDQLTAEATPDGLLLRPLPKVRLEAYVGDRVREFDAAEAELARVLATRPKIRSGRRTR